MLLQASLIAVAFATSHRLGRPGTRPGAIATVALLVGATLWMLFALTIAAWLWAGLFLWLGGFQTLEQALYFSSVSLTTLGFGDVVLPQRIRLLSSIVAANGLIMFGLSTAFLIEFVTRVRDTSGDQGGGEGA